MAMSQWGHVAFAVRDTIGLKCRYALVSRRAGSMSPSSPQKPRISAPV